MPCSAYRNVGPILSAVLPLSKPAPPNDKTSRPRPLTPAFGPAMSVGAGQPGSLDKDRPRTILNPEAKTTFRVSEQTSAETLSTRKRALSTHKGMAT